MRQTRFPHPAVQLLRKAQEQNLSEPGRLEAGAWKALWRPDKPGFAVIRLVTTDLSEGQRVETAMEIAKDGLGPILHCEAGARQTVFHLRVPAPEPVQPPPGSYLDYADDGTVRFVMTGHERRRLGFRGRPR